MYYAHSNDSNLDDWQLLIDHLQNVADIASDLGKDINLSNQARAIGLYHDIGKYSEAFQKRLHGSSKRVDHATAGAIELKDLMNSVNPILGTILAFCILGHHGGLPDYGSPIDDPSENTLCARLKRKALLENYSAYQEEIDKISSQDLINIRLNPITESGAFSISFLTRMLYSLLVEADFLDTEKVMSDQEKPRGIYDEIDKLTETFNQFLRRFDQPETFLHHTRTKILNECLQGSKLKPGLFSLTVPTGGGKTYSSMAFALNHALLNNLKRIIYVIPYTSIIEQNAALFKEILGFQNVLEHHSNFDWKQSMDFEQSDDEELSTKLKLASENWDIPVVVTTNVQFFESLFSNKPSRSRKVHNLAQSVIIFDEVQMLPREFIKPCVYSVAELVMNYGSTAIFCTATQPIIENFLPEKMKRPVELVENPQQLYKDLKRVNIISLGKVPDEEIIKQINHYPQVLCIVNTRKHAKGLFMELHPGNRYHLSTLMCAAHRREVLKKVKGLLKKGKTCQLISTQLIEAGVDIDFPVGFRALAGLDSIIQAAGRINRENKNDIGMLFVFEPDSPCIKKIPTYIQQGADVARKILRDFAEDPTSLDAVHAYFKELYDLQDPTISFDRENIIGYFEKPGVTDAEFDFKTAAEKFHLIDNAMKSIIVPYSDKVYELLEEVKTSLKPRKFLRDLQPYAVNIFEQEFNALQSLGRIDVYNDSVFVLNDYKNFYSEETGLVIPENTSGIAISF